MTIMRIEIGYMLWLRRNSPFCFMALSFSFSLFLADTPAENFNNAKLVKILPFFSYCTTPSPHTHTQTHTQLGQAERK
jgi:hypothetical protein